MKPILLFSLTVLVACSSVDALVESDYNYEGNFNKYGSYLFAQNDSFEGSDEDAELIEKYLIQTLTSWGYKQKSKKPDLVIFYSFYFDSFDFLSYNQPSFEHWIRSNYHDGLIVDTLDTNYPRIRRSNENYNKTRLSLQEGTILISFYDRKKQTTVWQGFASGVFGPDNISNKRTFRYVINRIMYEYKLLAYNKENS